MAVRKDGAREIWGRTSGRGGRAVGMGGARSTKMERKTLGAPYLLAFNQNTLFTDTSHPIQFLRVSPKILTAYSSNLTFSLEPGWAFVETEDWRKDLEASWIEIDSDAGSFIASACHHMSSLLLYRWLDIHRQFVAVTSKCYAHGLGCCRRDETKTLDQANLL